MQQNLQVYFTKGCTTTLDKLEVEVASPLRLEHNVPILGKLVIIPNLEIQAIINDESPVREVERIGPIATLGGDITSSVATPEILSRVFLFRVISVYFGTFQ